MEREYTERMLIPEQHYSEDEDQEIERLLQAIKSYADQLATFQSSTHYSLSAVLKAENIEAQSKECSKRLAEMKRDRVTNLKKW